ncbi:MAG: hypothetical protein HYZ53_26400 [Planctomycetes bacterium]|nr:hypothetical protein [Planctomycetota bacterium]
MRPLPTAPYIIWSCDPSKLDAEDPWTRRWWIGEVLVHGRWEDVRRLDWGEVRCLLPELRLPPRVRRLWEYYFAVSGKRPDDGLAGRA